MDNLSNDLSSFLPLVPILFVGILSGIFGYINSECNNLKSAIKIVSTSAFLSLIAFCILSATDLPYLAKVGCSAGIGYFGIDKALELIAKMLSFKNAPNKESKKE